MNPQDMDADVLFQRAVQEAEHYGHTVSFWLNIHDILVVFAGHRIAAANPAWTVALGWSEAETVGRDWRTLCHPDDLAASEATVGPIPGPCSEIRNRYAAKDGGYVALDWRWSGQYLADNVYASARVVCE